MQSGFWGNVEHQLDDKSRLTIPAKHREMLPTGSFIAPGWPGCLFIFPKQIWDEISSQFSGRLLDADALRVQRWFSRGVELEMDRAGRVLLPPKLREHANIDREVVIVGVGKWLEIWDKQTWAAYESKELSQELVTASADEMLKRL